MPTHAEFRSASFGGRRNSDTCKPLSYAYQTRPSCPVIDREQQSFKDRVSTRAGDKSTRQNTNGLIALSDGLAIKVRRKASAWNPFSVPFRSCYCKTLMKSCS